MVVEVFSPSSAEVFCSFLKPLGTRQGGSHSLGSPWGQEAHGASESCSFAIGDFGAVPHAQAILWLTGQKRPSLKRKS